VVLLKLFSPRALPLSSESDSSLGGQEPGDASSIVHSEHAANDHENTENGVSPRLL